MQIVDTKAKYNPDLITAANGEAKQLKAHPGVSQIDIMGAKNLLATIEHMHPVQAGHKAALTKAVKALGAAIEGAHVDANVRGMPPIHTMNPPLIKIRADDNSGHVVIKIRADEPLPIPNDKVHTKVTAKRSHELAAAVHMMKTSTIGWKDGHLQSHLPVGERFAQVAIEDHRATDGNAVYAFIPLGALTRPDLEKKVDPNKVNEFYLQLLPGRGGKEMFAGPFNVPDGIEVAPKLMAKAESIGEKVAENHGKHLSKSDSVFLRDLKKLPNGHFQAKFDVTFWLDPNKDHGHITVEVDANGKIFGKGEFKAVRAHDA